MFTVSWDKKNNLVKLLDNKTDDSLSFFPRIVFTDELRLLKIDKYKYTSHNKPVCWCADRKYYYKGKIIFEAKGGDLYNEPTIVYPDDIEFDCLENIDIEFLKRKNKKLLDVLENEAMDFINEQYEFFLKKVDFFAVAFSGGKDSQVVLDLVSKVIPPQKYKAFYTNTGMELPCTFDTVKKTADYYSKTYPEFEMVICESEIPVVEQWEKYGPPSRMNRWCCKVRKTALFTRKLKEVLNTDKQPKCVVYEGVRADESARREEYNRVGIGVKHTNLVNCRPIFHWNDTEVYLYLVCRSAIPINKGYTKGLTRIGCNICPFASSWSEFVIHKAYPEISTPFIKVIEKMGKNIGINDHERLNDYISSGNWKKNAGGKGLDYDNSRMDVIKKEPDYECIIKYPKEDWKIWINTIGKYTLDKTSETTYDGTIKYNDDIIGYNITQSTDKLVVKLNGTSGKLYLTSFMNKVLMKTTYCERCGVCEAECPTGALVIRKEKFYINPLKCIHCHKCYEVNSYGCIVAARRRVTEGGISVTSDKTKSSGIDRYSTFGLREEWFSSIMDIGDEWFTRYPGLGPKMIPAAINWFRDADIIDAKEKHLSEFGKLIQYVYSKNNFLSWQLIWIKLCYNSGIVTCYVKDLINNCKYSKSDIITMLQYRYPNLSDNTLGNPVVALLNMFENSPIGCQIDDADFSNYSLRMGVITHVGRERIAEKRGTNNISRISIAYLLYLLAEKEKRYSFTVTELYENNDLLTPFNIFNISLDKFHGILRSLTEDGYLTAELLGGLDNIKLNSNFCSLNVLKEMVKKI